MILVVVLIIRIIIIIIIIIAMLIIITMVQCIHKVYYKISIIGWKIVKLTNRQMFRVFLAGKIIIIIIIIARTMAIILSNWIWIR